ncbi:MAG: 6-phosphogluconolactonase, partial [Lactococcus sp.]
VIDNLDELTNQVVKKICLIVKKKPDAVLCFACGETPRPIMNKLIILHKNKEIDFSRVRIVGLDEWLGVDRETVGSCAQMLYDDFFTPMNFREDQISIFNGKSNNLQKEITDATRIVDELGIDFVLLGIGMNGHIGLNEPGTEIGSGVRVVQLSTTTKQVMGKYFEGHFDIQSGITLGFSQLLNSRNIVLMATGNRKSEIVKKIVHSEPNIDIPATFFKKSNYESEFYIDKDAGNDIYLE